MTEFAKYVDEDTIIRPRKNYKSNTLVAFNFDKNIELMRSQGYLPLQYDDEPNQLSANCYWKPQYELTDEAILVHWVEEEVQEEGID